MTRRNNHNRKIFKVLGSKSGSGSTFSKCGSEDPDPDPLLWKGGSEDPDPLLPNVDPRIRIHIKMRWIRNAAYKPILFWAPTSIFKTLPYTLNKAQILPCEIKMRFSKISLKIKKKEFLEKVPFIVCTSLKCTIANGHIMVEF